jgi:ferredoxin-like protein FixX
LNLFHIDKKPHIEIKQEICRKCPHKACTYVCPVENYNLVDGEVVFAWEGCLDVDCHRLRPWDTDYPTGDRHRLRAGVTHESVFFSAAFI